MSASSSPIKQPNAQNKTLSLLKEVDLAGANKPNFVLVFKISQQPSNKIGTQIRQKMFARIKHCGWKAKNKQTSQFYYRRYDGLQENLTRDTKADLLRAMEEVKTFHQGDWGINFIIVKPLSAAGVHRPQDNDDSASNDDDNDDSASNDDDNDDSTTGASDDDDEFDLGDLLVGF